MEGHGTASAPRECRSRKPCVQSRGAAKRNKLRANMFSGRLIEWDNFMPYTRPIRQFYLTPPTVLTFVISMLLAVLAVLSVYGHIPRLHSVSAFTFLLVAYVFLLLGTLFRGI
jgi:uncharacterized membrane protein YphA (DoxX/SURF4 family)